MEDEFSCYEMMESYRGFVECDLHLAIYNFGGYDTLRYIMSLPSIGIIEKGNYS